MGHRIPPALPLIRLRRALRNNPAGRCGVLFDFDNTVTSFDVLDEVIRRFAADRSWVAYENAWRRGKIGSRACLQGQVGALRVSRRVLLRYLRSVKVDPAFKKLCAFFRRRRIRPVIVSDSFSLFIRQILSANRVRGIPVFSNLLRARGERWIPSFPHENPACLRCGHCKKNNLLSLGKVDTIIYIGDGRSDICPALHADIVFAKAELARFLSRRGKAVIAFRSLADVYRYVKGCCDGQEDR